MSSIADLSTDRSNAHPCLSLPHALCAVAHARGYEIDLDDLCAAMGLSFTVTAIPEEPDSSKWTLYARDAFLVPAARLFGMTIRDIHPPEAAIGVAKSVEFSQHFDASYRPIILRALEHNQPVLAWQGWPASPIAHVRDPEGADFDSRTPSSSAGKRPEAICCGHTDMLWGVITNPCEDGVGFRGTIHASPDDAAELTLHRPPVQLYVIESIVQTKPDAEEVLAMARDHAKQVLDNALSDRFGVTTGPRAYDDWIERLRARDVKVPSYLLEITAN